MFYFRLRNIKQVNMKKAASTETALYLVTP